MHFTDSTIGLNHEQSWFIDESTQTQEYGYGEAAELLGRTSVLLRDHRETEIALSGDHEQDRLIVNEALEKDMVLCGAVRVLQRFKSSRAR